MAPRRGRVGATLTTGLLLAAGAFACAPGDEEVQPTGGGGGAQLVDCTGLPGRDSLSALFARVTFRDSGADSATLRYATDEGAPTGPFSRIYPAQEQSLAPVGGVVARVQADAAFAPLGYAAGNNFIYIDSTAAGWRSSAVPEDPSVPITCHAMYVTGIAPDTADSALRAGFFDLVGIPSGAWTACRGGGRDNCCCTHSELTCSQLRHPPNARLIVTRTDGTAPATVP